jgi:hypothetical protein
MWTSRRLAMWLAPLSGTALLLAALALQDIYHAETDVRLEWAMVRTAFVITALFHVFAFRALRRG